MKIRFLTSEAGAAGWYYNAGEVQDLPEATARNFIRRGVAVEVREVCPHCGGDLTDAPEAAALAPAGERATLPSARKRG